ncbi:contactin-associated protein-like 5 [Ruditapes philippinarum]|uniref:contactin-associated protein-like 5 n=1 Tax=Ruditapes philippinarum TaxID=129788 RepID=UPI00295AD49D|nr:contactin-associated protein-like 5 [Ruditapes philippinarum]
MDIRLRLLVAITLLLTKVCVECQNELCHDKLIQHLPDDHLTASSSKSDPGLLSTPVQARLNKTENTLNNGTTLMGAWSPTSDNGGQYVQAMFDEMTMVTGIQTQGRNQGTDHVTLYKVEYTEDGKTWHLINNDLGLEQIFMGNSDGDSIVDNPLSCPVFAKGIRIIPMEWDQHIALRFEVNGCYLDNTVIVLTTPSAGTTPTLLTTMSLTNATTIPTFLPGIATPFSLTTQPATTKPGTTINMSTLIQWFKTHLNNNTAVTTSPAVKTTTPAMFMPGIQHPFGPTQAGIGVPPIIG